MRSKRRDIALIDAIEAIDPIVFDGPAWRVVRDGRDPTLCSRSGGRWDDGTFEVLYTSLAPDGAIAEMHFHLARGQPVFPSRVAYRLHELGAAMKRALRLIDLAALAALGLDASRYGQPSYAGRQTEYPRSQDIAETAHFLEFDGLLVPNARWDCLNAVLFCDRVAPGTIAPRRNLGLVDWDTWIATRTSR